MILKTLICALLTVVWTPKLTVEGGVSTLTLTGQIEKGYYIHPATDPYSGVTLSVEGAVDSPEEVFKPSDYKGETVAEGKYVIRQKLSGTPASVKGSVQWSACSGDFCKAREEYEFTAHMQAPSKSLLALILEAILWGLAMLLTPCVFPMVPMTVSFFMNQKGGRFKAAMYGLFIVLLYTLPICILIGISFFAGGEAVTGDIFNFLATHWLPNLLFFAVFLTFAASFLGAFEIVLPAKWTTSTDAKSGRGGLAGVFFLALTLVLVSFSCTGPIVGTVLIKSLSGEFWTPVITMLAFSIAFALPFTLLAFFPTLLEKLPRSGGWLNSVKVVLGFVEIVLAFKFLSVADQTYHWHILSRELYLAIWIVCFTLIGLYLLGKIRFRNDTPVEHVSVLRLVLALASFVFVIYLVPGLWGAPLKAMSGYLPPQEVAVPPSATGESATSFPLGLVAYEDEQEAMAAAQREGKNIFVDISGHGCVNCREMESRVWSAPLVLEMLRDNYVIYVIYMDDKTRLPEEEWLTTPGGKVLKDKGRVNSYRVMQRFGVNSQPNYFILSPSGETLAGPRSYSLDVDAFADFLRPHSKIPEL